MPRVNQSHNIEKSITLLGLDMDGYINNLEKINPKFSKIIYLSHMPDENHGAETIIIYLHPSISASLQH